MIIHLSCEVLPKHTSVGMVSGLDRGARVRSFYSTKYWQAFESVGVIPTRYDQSLPAQSQLLFSFGLKITWLITSGK